MKRQIQLRGERDWAGDDLIDLQAEPLKAIDAIFAPYPACVVDGCKITANGSAFDVAKGYVSLKGADHNNKSVSMVVPFAELVGVTTPIFLTLGFEVVNDVYGDGTVKPIAYHYQAVASMQQPAADVQFLKLDYLDAPTFQQVIGSGKVDKIANKGLSSNDYTLLEKNKLSGIADNANKYIHPDDTSTQHVSDEEKNKWNSVDFLVGECRGIAGDASFPFSVNKIKGEFTVSEFDVVDGTSQGKYRITHNLDTTKYHLDLILASQDDFSFPGLSPHQLLKTDNYIDVGFYLQSKQGLEADCYMRTPFDFKITVFK